VKKLVLATLVVAISAPVMAQSMLANVDAIVDASQNNELKFKRDWKGKQITLMMTYKGSSEQLFGGGFYIDFINGAKNTISCKTGKTGIDVDQATDLSKGQRMTVTGTVQDTTLGQLFLTQCQFGGKS
jgi:hypothetical protein